MAGRCDGRPTRGPALITAATMVTAGVYLTLMLLGGAVGKSAQLPLQDVAGRCDGRSDAGLRADPRCHHGNRRRLSDCPHRSVPADAGSAASGGVGAITLVLAGFAALVQTDIKRVLAYSTMSQIGYMFGAGRTGVDAAIFHLMTHAFFKALLFLSSGSVILACHHEQNIKMGGLRKSIPLVYVCFWWAVPRWPRCR